MNRTIRTLIAAATLTAPAFAFALPSVQGGADRGDATVSGTVSQASNGTVSGKLMMVIRPSVPDSSTLALVCSYRTLYNLTVVGNVASFDARGTCTVLDDDGTLPAFAVANHFTITDNGAGPDGIDVNFYGPSGPAVPGGLVSYGDFTVTP